MRRLQGLSVLALVLGLLPGAARPAQAEPSVWVVHGKACTVTLFGSIHVLPAGLNWEPPALAQALAQADELWFEIPIDPTSQAEAAAEAQAHAFLPEGQELSKLMTTEGARRMAAFADLHHLSLARLNRMQPWFADLLISSFAYTVGGAGPQSGVEEQLSQTAPQVPRKAFETVRQQIDMISSAPQDTQIASLEASLKQADSDPDDYRHLVDAWMKGDGRTIYRHDVLSLKDDTPVLFRILMTDRNAAWTRTLAQRLTGTGHVVVVVGAAHLLGPDGLPAALRARGFQVDGPAD